MGRRTESPCTAAPGSAHGMTDFQRSAGMGCGSVNKGACRV